MFAKKVGGNRMANQEQLDILKQGVETWNEWRKEHATIRPDLRGADLSEADLTGADFSEADLVAADLTGADLSEANLNYAVLWQAHLRHTNLSEADFSEADFSNADLSNADLSHAMLGGADLSKADLSKADLRYSYLGGADLSKADLTAADLGGAWVEGTVFGDVDLSAVTGLDTIDHYGPSTIGIDTIYRSHGDIPEVFLKGAGVDDTFITYIRSLLGKANEYYSCFISYSSKDNSFARRLYNDLQSHNVRCWFAPEDLKWGEKIRTGIDEAISRHDKLLLILSKHSIASGWIEHEVKTALAREQKEKRTVLFPVRVDRAVFDSPFDWAIEIRHERNIGDFTRWKNHDDYQKAFTRLLRDLMTGDQKMRSRDATTNDR